MKRIIFILVCIFSSAESQVVENLSYTELDVKKIENIFIQELNKYRVSLQVQPLKKNDDFYYVAENQIDFLIKLNTEINRVTDSSNQNPALTHGQKNEYELGNKKIKLQDSEFKKNLVDRFGKKSEKTYMGENLAFVYLNCWNLNECLLSELDVAKKFLQSFKTSKGHESTQTNILYKEVTCCVKKMPYFFKDKYKTVIELEICIISVVFTN